MPGHKIISCFSACFGVRGKHSRLGCLFSCQQVTLYRGQMGSVCVCVEGWGVGGTLGNSFPPVISPRRFEIITILVLKSQVFQLLDPLWNIDLTFFFVAMFNSLCYASSPLKAETIGRSCRAPTSTHTHTQTHTLHGQVHTHTHTLHAHSVRLLRP